MRTKSPLIGWIAAAAFFAYGIYGFLHKGIYFPYRHGHGGALLTGMAAGTMLFGLFCVLLNLSYILFFGPPPGPDGKIDAPLPAKVLLWVGAAAAVASAFLPGVQHDAKF